MAATSQQDSRTMQIAGMVAVLLLLLGALAWLMSGPQPSQVVPANTGGGPATGGSLPVMPAVIATPDASAAPAPPKVAATQPKGLCEDKDFRRVVAQFILACEVTCNATDTKSVAINQKEFEGYFGTEDDGVKSFFAVFPPKSSMADPALATPDEVKQNPGAGWSQSTHPYTIDGDGAQNWEVGLTLSEKKAFRKYAATTKAALKIWLGSGWIKDPSWGSILTLGAASKSRTNPGSMDASNMNLAKDRGGNIRNLLTQLEPRMTAVPTNVPVNNEDLNFAKGNTASRIQQFAGSYGRKVDDQLGNQIALIFAVRCDLSAENAVLRAAPSAAAH